MSQPFSLIHAKINRNLDESGCRMKKSNWPFIGGVLGFIIFFIAFFQYEMGLRIVFGLLGFAIGFIITNKKLEK